MDRAIAGDPGKMRTTSLIKWLGKNLPADATSFVEDLWATVHHDCERQADAIARLDTTRGSNAEGEPCTSQAKRAVS
jgi:hypothetical protein